jgi:hypothetical protein
MRRTAIVFREFKAVTAAGRKLESLGWVAAALDLERKKRFESREYSGCLVQSIFLSNGRDFVALSLRPSPRAKSALLRKTRTRAFESQAQRAIQELQYGVVKDSPRGRGMVFCRRLSQVKDIDGDWERAYQACRPRTLARKGPLRLPPRIVGRRFPGAKATARAIWKAIDLFQGPDAKEWRPDYICFRKRYKFSAVGLRWWGALDLLLHSPYGVRLSLWLQADVKMAVRQAQRVMARHFLEQVTRDLGRLGCIVDAGPVVGGPKRMIYADYDYRGLKLGSLYASARLLSSWQPPKISVLK